MPQPNDLSRSLVALDQNSTIIAVIEMSQSSWLVAGVLPGIERQPRKKLEPSPERLLAVLHRWRDEAVRAGRTITRIAIAFEAGRDGFWLEECRRMRGGREPPRFSSTCSSRAIPWNRAPVQLGWVVPRCS
jgi:transposase